MDVPSEADAYRAWKSWDRERFGEVPPETALYYRQELERAGIADRRPLNVLEIGFGNGGFAAYCRARGHTYLGTEIDPELVERALAAGFEARVAPDDPATLAAPGSLDLICCFDVLEHLTTDQIVAMLSAFRGLLKAGGRVLARFPSGDSPFSLGMYNGDITHRNHIGRGAVLQFCVATGLEAVQIRQANLPIFGLGPARALRRALVAGCRWAIRTALRAVMYDGVPRVVDPNMVIVLRRAPDQS